MQPRGRGTQLNQHPLLHTLSNISNARRHNSPFLKLLSLVPMCSSADCCLEDCPNCFQNWLKS